MKTKFEIFCDRGDGRLANDGCWGGDNNIFGTLEEAKDAAEFLAKNYPDCDWVVVEVKEVFRIERKEVALSATWDDDLQSYVCGEWISVDGDYWIDKNGESVVCDSFREASIELFGGPRNGFIVG